MKKVDKTGKKYGRLTVVEKVPAINGRKESFYRCSCACGGEKIVMGSNLREGHTGSCGCLIKEKLNTGLRYIHGVSKTRFGHIFKQIVARCNKEYATSWNRYGAKGIKCEWESLEEFKNDMYDSYVKHVREFGEKQTTIDRINSNDDYKASNCRWATLKEQANNKRKKS